jgi:16S rRNA (cytidine1402-2'-O)-methyltransferase
VTSKLLGRHGISAQLVSFREHNAAKVLPRLIDRLKSGDDVALVTDAGTPGVSDPGYALVSAAASAGIPVTPIPGPSAMIAAVSAAGLSGDEIRFVGFLPRSGRRRSEKLLAVASDPSLTVIFESPRRLSKTLKEIVEVCGKERRAAVAREITKLHEEIARGTLAELAQRFSGETKGEVTIVIEGNISAGVAAHDEASLQELIAGKIAQGCSAKDVASFLSAALGLPRKKIYEIAVSIISSQRD